MSADGGRERALRGGGPRRGRWRDRFHAARDGREAGRGKQAALCRISATQANCNHARRPGRCANTGSSCSVPVEGSRTEPSPRVTAAAGRPEACPAGQARGAPVTPDRRASLSPRRSPAFAGACLPGAPNGPAFMGAGGITRRRPNSVSRSSLPAARTAQSNPTRLPDSICIGLFQVVFDPFLHVAGCSLPR